MNGRFRGLSLGLALLALLGIASVAGRGVFAQDATPTPGASSGTDSDQTTGRNAFLDAFAAALGVTDQVQVDAAIKTAVDKMLADKVAAGEITQEQADIIKAEVANGDYRAIGGGFGIGHDPRGGMHGRDRGGFGGDKGHSGSANDKNDDDSDDNGTTPSTGATPAASSAGVSA